MSFNPNEVMKDYNESGAAFNIGLSTAFEIRRLLNECNNLSREGFFSEWYNTLLVLEREVKAEMKKGDDTDINNTKIKATNIMTLYINNQFRYNNEAFKALHDFEISIRTIIKKRGLGMPDKADSRFALGN